jgi:hypothetical protein
LPTIGAYYQPSVKVRESLLKEPLEEVLVHFAPFLKPHIPRLLPMIKKYYQLRFGTELRGNTLDDAIDSYDVFRALQVVLTDLIKDLDFDEEEWREHLQPPSSIKR